MMNEIFSEAYFGRCQTSKMDVFPKSIIGLKILDVFAKNPILGAWLGTTYAIFTNIRNISLVNLFVAIISPKYSGENAGNVKINFYNLFYNQKSNWMQKMETLKNRWKLKWQIE